MRQTISMVMGIKPSILWASNFLLIFLILSLDALILTLVFWLGGLISNTDPSLVLLLLLNYGVSIILFTFLLSVIMKKSTSGAVASLLLFILTFLPVLIPVSLSEEVQLTLRIIWPQNHLAIESLGGWHELAVAEIRKLAAALARQSGQD